MMVLYTCFALIFPGSVQLLLGIERVLQDCDRRAQIQSIHRCSSPPFCGPYPLCSQPHYIQNLHLCQLFFPPVRRYVVQKDTKNNVVFASRNYYSVDKRRRVFRVGSLKWLGGLPSDNMSELQCKVKALKHRLYFINFFVCDFSSMMPTGPWKFLFVNVRAMLHMSMFQLLQMIPHRQKPTHCIVTLRTVKKHILNLPNYAEWLVIQASCSSLISTSMVYLP